MVANNAVAAAYPPPVEVVPLYSRVRLGGDLWHPLVPSGSVSVARPGRWGNPHPVGKPCKRCGQVEHDRAHAVRMFDLDLRRGRLAVSVRAVRQELRGLDLACWCKPGELCHGDVLLSIANSVEL